MGFQEEDIQGLPLELSMRTAHAARVHTGTSQRHVTGTAPYRSRCRMQECGGLARGGQVACLRGLGAANGRATRTSLLARFRSGPECPQPGVLLAGSTRHCEGQECVPEELGVVLVQDLDPCERHGVDAVS